MSTDPIGFEAGDVNLYRYVGNGVSTSTDYSGLFKFRSGSCNATQRSMITATLWTVYRMLSNSPGCFTHGHGGKNELDERECRMELRECLMKTIASGITIQCDPNMKDYGHAGHNDENPCMKAKSWPSSGHECTDPPNCCEPKGKTCQPCPDELLDRSTMTLGTKSADLEIMGKAVIHEFLHQCVGGGHIGVDKAGRPLVDRILKGTSETHYNGLMNSPACAIDGLTLGKTIEDIADSPRVKNPGEIPDNPSDALPDGRLPDPDRPFYPRFRPDPLDPEKEYDEKHKSQFMPLRGNT